MGAEASFRGIFVMGYLRPEKQSGHLEGLAQLVTQALIRSTILAVIQFADRSISEDS